LITALWISVHSLIPSPRKNIPISPATYLFMSYSFGSTTHLYIYAATPFRFFGLCVLPYLVARNALLGLYPA
jgi:hypothetical protein